MKLSLKTLGINLYRFGKRHPLLLLTVLCLTTIGLAFIRDGNIIADYPKIGLVLRSLIVSLILGTGLKGRPTKRNTLLYVGIVTGFGVWTVFLPERIDVSLGIMLAVCVMSALAWLVRYPLTDSQSDDAVRRRIGHIIQHIAAGAVFVVILGGGLMASLGAIDALFGISISGKIYMSILIIVSTLVGMTSTLDGILSHQMSHHTPVRWQTTLARSLIILIAVFVTIIYIYLGKILFTQTRPSNEVGIRGFVTIGFLLMGSIFIIPLLDYDIKKKQTLRRRAHLVIVPIVFMVGTAIYQRVTQYGITEPRYLSSLLVILVGLTSLRQLITRRLGSYLLFVGIFGIGFYAVCTMRPVARYSQMERLVDYLTDEGLYDGSHFNTIPLELNPTQKKYISEYLEYFYIYNRTNLAILDDRLDEKKNTEAVFGVEDGFYRHTSHHTRQRKTYYYHTDSFDISSYNTIYPHISTYAHPSKNIVIDDDSISILNNKSTVATFKTSAFITRLVKQDEDNTDQPLTLTGNNGVFVIKSINLQTKNTDTRSIQDIEGILLLK